MNSPDHAKRLIAALAESQLLVKKTPPGALRVRNIINPPSDPITSWEWVEWESDSGEQIREYQPPPPEEKTPTVCPLGEPPDFILPLQEERKSFIEWRDEGRMVMKGQKGTRDPSGTVTFGYSQTREIPANLYDDLGLECNYDGDGV